MYIYIYTPAQELTGFIFICEKETKSRAPEERLFRRDKGERERVEEFSPSGAKLGLTGAELYL